MNAREPVSTTINNFHGARAAHELPCYHQTMWPPSRFFNNSKKNPDKQFRNVCFFNLIIIHVLLFYKILLICVRFVLIYHHYYLLSFIIIHYRLYKMYLSSSLNR